MDLRREKRFRANYPVEIEPEGGVTIDMSGTGVAFETTHNFEPGDPITLRIRLSRRPSESPLELRCSGKVVRVTPMENGSRVAASVEWLEQPEEESDFGDKTMV